jgi:hypothetical protein
MAKREEMPWVFASCGQVPYHPVQIQGMINQLSWNNTYVVQCTFCDCMDTQHVHTDDLSISLNICLVLYFNVSTPANYPSEP